MMKTDFRYIIKRRAVWKEERWVTGESTGPDGKEEGMDEAHVIARLPFGAYILQEEGVPFEQGYVQASVSGIDP